MLAAMTVVRSWIRINAEVSREYNWFNTPPPVVKLMTVAMAVPLWQFFFVHASMVPGFICEDCFITFFPHFSYFLCIFCASRGLRFVIAAFPEYLQI